MGVFNCGINESTLLIDVLLRKWCRLFGECGLNGLEKMSGKNISMETHSKRKSLLSTKNSKKVGLINYARKVIDKIVNFNVNNLLKEGK